MNDKLRSIAITLIILAGAVVFVPVMWVTDDYEPWHEYKEFMLRTWGGYAHRYPKYWERLR